MSIERQIVLPFDERPPAVVAVRRGTEVMLGM